MENGDKIIAQIRAFKDEGTGDEVYDDTEVLDITDVSEDTVEIAFHHIHKERIYLRFNLGDLVNATHRYGRGS